MANIKSNTPFDAVLQACDPYDLRGDCATGVMTIAAQLLGARNVHSAAAPVTTCNDHVFVGRAGAGKSRVIAALEAVASVLGIPCINTWPKSYDAALQLLHRTMQHAKKGEDGEPQYETVHTRLLVVLDEQGALSGAQGRGDAAAMAVAGVQTCINMTADGVIANSEAVSRSTPPWPKLEGVTVIWARFAQVETGAALLAASRGRSNGAERRQAVWTIESAVPCDEYGAPLSPTTARFYLAREAIYAKCFNISQLKRDVDSMWAPRMRAELRADLGAVPKKRVTVTASPRDEIFAALEAAARGDDEWSATGGGAALLQAQHWAGLHASMRGADTTDETDWHWAVQVVDRVHANGEMLLAEQDSETRQKDALDEVRRHFSRTPSIDSGEEPRPQDRLRSVFTWIGGARARQQAFWDWAIRNLVLAPGYVAGRREKCFFRAPELTDLTPTDCPRDGFREDFLALLQRAHAARGMPWPWPAPQNPAQ